jgi:hypothetical protein
MTDIEKYNKYYKGLTIDVNDGLNKYILGDVNEYNNICIYWDDIINGGYNETKIPLDYLLQKIKIGDFTISKTELRKRKIELIKNE